MTTISGRYGSVQRVLPSSYENGLPVWGAPNTDWKQKATMGLTGNPSTNMMAAAGGGDTVSSVTSWSLENNMQPIEYGASNTRGYKGKLEGIHSCTGNIAGIGGIPPIAPGQRFRFYGFVGPSNGMLDNVYGQVYCITAITTSLQIQINYQMSQPITWTIQWQSDYQQEGDELQAYADSAGKGFWDYTRPPISTLLPSRTCNLQIEGVNTSTGVCLQDANIQFNTEVSQYANSCSAKAGGWQSAVIGATTCQVNATIHGYNYGLLGGLPGTNRTVVLYIEGNTDDAVDCSSLARWEFKKLMIGSFTGLTVDVTNNSPIQFSTQMDFNPFPMGSGGAAESGYIKYYDSIHTDGVDFYKAAPPGVTP